MLCDNQLACPRVSWVGRWNSLEVGCGWEWMMSSGVLALRLGSLDRRELACACVISWVCVVDVVQPEVL